MATEEVCMSVRQYTDEFKAAAIKQVVEREFTVVEVAARIRVPKHTLYDWVQGTRKAARTSHAGTPAASDSAEVRRLKAELKRVTEERDILKKSRAAATLCPQQPNVMAAQVNRNGVALWFHDRMASKPGPPG